LDLKIHFMKLLSSYVFFLFMLTDCKGQKSVGAEKLKLVKEIEMSEVKGRIDHMDFNPKDEVLYVAALGNNSVEVINLKNGRTVHSIKGIEEPQGIAYVQDQNEIAVASGGNGDCIFYNASTFQKLATIHLSSDADNVRYDAAEKKMYVGYGDGGLAMIDPVAHKLIGNIKFPAHPESFQLDKKNELIFVNLPDDHSIAVIDAKNFKLKDTWNISDLRANFPMTLDTADNLVIVGFRHPATLVAYNNKSGKEISKTYLVGDVDDVFYYADKKLVLASGGNGYINIFEKSADNQFKQIANIATRDGARTSLLIPSLGYFILAERANGSKAASLLVYRIDK
jgi:WD40 repeat protein